MRTLICFDLKFINETALAYHKTANLISTRRICREIADHSPSGNMP